MFEQVWNWVTEHLVPLLTATNITVVLGIIFTLVPKLKKSFGDSSAVAAKLTQKLSEISGIAEGLKSLETVINGLKADNADYAKAYTEIKEQMESLREKINTVLDIQNIAYNATDLSEVNDSITNAYTNVRFDTTQQRKKMAKGARETAAKVAELAAAVNEQLVEIEHAAEPKSEHISSISL